MKEIKRVPVFLKHSVVVLNDQYGQFAPVRLVSFWKMYYL